MDSAQGSGGSADRRIAELSLEQIEQLYQKPSQTWSAIGQGPVETTAFRQVDPKDGSLSRNRPPLGRRAARSPARFMISVFMGVAATLGWQSYGGATKQMIADCARQLGWLSSSPALNLPPSPDVAVEQPSPPAVLTGVNPVEEDNSPGSLRPRIAGELNAREQVSTPEKAPGQAETVAPSAPPPPSLELQQLESIVHDLGAVRQNVEQLAARQEQMARDIAKLQSAQRDARRRASAPSPRLAAPPRKPVPAPQPPAQSLAAPLPPALAR
jgi:hypothetical protein